jgi:uncharacterized protein YndB with AHSA1/START domain
MSPAAVPMIGLLGAMLSAPPALAAHRVIPGGFVVERDVTVPGSPEATYDAITGDITGWWDHSFSGHPRKIHIEARPGGGFYEIFNQRGDGARHATVIYADRGKLLRFDGPLGLSGRALQMVHTYEFEPAGSDSTRVKLTVRASGDMEENLPEVVDQVWRHFLVERFKPYVEANRGGRPMRR